MSIEIELKLALADQDAARLRKHPLLKNVKPIRRKLYGIYYDTPEFDLYRHKAAFRLRREGYHWVQTVKLDSGSVAGLSMRPEFETRVVGNQADFDALPKQARKALGAKVEARLSPLIVTDFQRTIWLIEQPRGCVEVSLDVGHIQVGETDLPLTELELELKSGDSALLFEIASSLLDAVPLVPEYRSKALRGYALAGVRQERPCKAMQADIGRSLPAAEVWRRALLAALGQLGHNLPGLLSDDHPEYVHQARVAVRRMLTLLRLGESLGLDHADWLDEWRWFMAELSPARDWDVFVSETLSGLCRNMTESGRLDELRARAENARLAARARARAAAGDQRLTRLIFTMSSALLSERHAGPAAEKWAARSLVKRFRRFGKLAEGFGHLDIAGRHQLRIAAKRLRYAGEVFAPLYGKNADRYLKRLAELQDSLGEANDMAVAQRLLTELDGDGRMAHAVGLMEGYLAAHAGHHGRRLAAKVKKLVALKPYWSAG
jgi:inorganic triphosphatase YgiF